MKPGEFQRFTALSREYEEFVKANEPDLIAYYTYLDETRSEVSLVQIHRDAKSAEHHVKVAAEKIAQGVALTDTVRIEIYGNPGPVVGQVRDANALSGAQISIKPEVLGGFARR